jgi:hypothetical protein
MDAIPEIYLEMRQQQKLRKFFLFKIFSDHLVKLQMFEFFVAVLVNLIMLGTWYYDTALGEVKFTGAWVSPCLLALGIILVVLAGFNFAFVLAQYALLYLKKQLRLMRVSFYI